MPIYKYSHWSFGDAEALINAVGEEDAKGLASGALVAVRVGQTVEIREAVKTLFDRHGNRIPPRGLQAAVCDPNREFCFVKPDINESALIERLGRAARHFPAGTGFLPAAKFVERVHILIEQIKDDKQLANLLKGVYLPICLPLFDVVDYGQTLDEVFLPAVVAAYKTQFPERSFTNCRQGSLANHVAVVPGTRHEQLLARMAATPVAGLYFPNPLQGYSVYAQREQMATLPESFLLCGGLDTAVGWVMYPDVLARDFNTTVSDCSALQWRSSGDSLYFEADGGRARFDDGGTLAGACDDSSGGLLFLG